MENEGGYYLNFVNAKIYSQVDDYNGYGYDCIVECGECECESELASSSLLRELKNLFEEVIDYLREMLGFESEKPIELEILIYITLVHILNLDY